MNYKRSAESTISGYLYQFDKTILELLNQVDENSGIVVEGIEDIDIEGVNIDPVSVQVKYYAETEYSHSVISEAVRNLFDHYIEYLNGRQERRGYHIYGHYKGGTEKLKVNEDYLLVEHEGKSSVDILKDSFLTLRPKGKEPVYYYGIKEIEYKEDSVIQNRRITDKEIEDFLSLLKININAEKLENQYDDILNKLKEELDNCGSIEEAKSYYYSNALNVIFKLAQEKDSSGREKEVRAKEVRKKITNLNAKIQRREKKLEESTDEKDKIQGELVDLRNEVSSKEEQVQALLSAANSLHKLKRTITKKDFIEQIDQKVFLFNKWFAAFKGNRQYSEYVKDQLVRSKSLNANKNKYLVIGKDYLKSLGSTNDITFVEFVKLVIEDSFEIGSAYARKSKVWTLVLDITKKKYMEIIKELNESNIEINSGKEEYIFNTENFNQEPIVNTTSNGVISRASYQIKIITLRTFEKNSDEIDNIDVVLFFMKDEYKKYVKRLRNRSITSFIVDGIEGQSLSDIVFLFDVMTVSNDYFRVINVSPSLLQIEVIKPQKFKDLNEDFYLGSYIKVTDEKNSSIIGTLKSYKVKEINVKDDDSLVQRKDPSFILDIQPIGHLVNNEFRKGNNNITIPPNNVEVVNNELLRSIFNISNRNKAFCFSDLPDNLTGNEENVNVMLDGDKFFNKHLAVVGSTGSGKSCTVAKILQEGIKPFTSEEESGALNNSHIILFDIHGEYQNAFKERCRYLSVNNLKLPYWLMNSEELQEYFLDADGSDHNQRNIFKKAVTLNKKWNNLIVESGVTKINENITYDSPVYFSIKEVLCCIENYNNARTFESIYTWVNPVDDSDIQDIMPESYDQLENYSKLFTTKLDGKEGKGTQKASLNFTNFISRLESKIFDERLNFLLKKGQEYKVELREIISQFIGYKTELENQENDNKNVTIIDLSGMPFEVVNVVVALVSKLVFEFAFKRKQLVEIQENEVPFLLVYEEAHNYIPKSTETKYKSVREEVERIAKEGRKYGVSAMIVSQRPSEISETIFSQCNSFVVMRLTNPVDQNYIKRMLPEDVGSITDNLASFDQREALIIGDAVKIPALVKVHEIPEDFLPKSNDVDFIQEWRKDWDDINDFDEIIEAMEFN